MKELFVIEATRPGWGHASFNAAMLHALVNKADARGIAVKVFCERGHAEALALLLPKNDRLSWESIPVVDGFNRRFAWKFIVEFSVVFRLLLRARRRGASVVLLAMFPNALAAVLLMQPIFKNVRVHITLHGELESLILEEKQHIYKEGFWTKVAVLKLFSGSWPSLYVLGEGIRRRVLSTFAERKQLQNIRAIKHPYLFTDAAMPQSIQQQRRPLRIGFVGAGRIIKGVTDFFGLAKSMSRYVDEGLVKFVVVGGVEPAALPSKNEYALVLADKVVSLSASDYSRAIAELDCAVFLPRQDYSLTASGSVFDIVNHGVEIFSIRNCYFADIAQLDDEGGIKFFDDVRSIAAEIARRAEGAEGFQRFKYTRIKREHSERALDTLISEVFASTDSYPRRADCADDQV